MKEIIQATIQTAKAFFGNMFSVFQNASLGKPIDLLLAIPAIIGTLYLGWRIVKIVWDYIENHV